MATTMAFPRTQPLQTGSISAQQTTAQQTSGIDISTLMNLMLPAMVVGMMAKMMSNLGKPKQAKAATTESTTPQTEEATTTS